MNEPTTQREAEPDPSSSTNVYTLAAYALKIILFKFGAYSYGPIMVIVIHFALYTPQLDALNARDQARDELVKTMVEQSLAATRSAEHAAKEAESATANSRATASILERILSNITRDSND